MEGDVTILNSALRFVYIASNRTSRFVSIFAEDFYSRMLSLSFCFGKKSAATLFLVVFVTTSLLSSFSFLSSSSLSVVSAYRTRNMPMVGGFSQKNVADEDVISAAEVAIAELASSNGAIASHTIQSAESQVVAGVNYRLTLAVEHENGNSVTYRVVVYKPLPHTGEPMKVTNTETV